VEESFSPKSAKELWMTSQMTTSTVDKHAEILHIAEDLYAKQPDWATFYREILGAKGIVRHTFPTRQQLIDFKQTAAYHEIQRMLSELRKIDLQEEPTRVITVRIPKSLHEGLFTEAHEHHTSINKLCISKLLQFIENEMVPQDRGRSEKIRS
jgi:predicted HicB family RNase H-like nuclease